MFVLELIIDSFTMPGYARIKFSWGTTIKNKSTVDIPIPVMLIKDQKAYYFHRKDGPYITSHEYEGEGNKPYIYSFSNKQKSRR